MSPAAGIPQWELGGGHPRLTAIRPDLFLLVVEQRLTTVNDALFVFEGFAGVFLREEVKVRLAHHFGGVMGAYGYMSGFVHVV